MRAPAFWSNPRSKPGLAAALLSPLSAIWMWEARRRWRQGAQHRLKIPVICVGNINIGGTGKTPTVIELVTRLQALGREPHILTRGFGGTETGPKRVDALRHKASAVGDEPLLLAAFAPTWVARDRMAGGLAAVADGADVLLLDDGMQNSALAKDLIILVADAAAGFGNGRVAPAGPLREPVDQGMERADLVLAIGSEEDRDRFLAEWPETGRKPCIGGTLEPLETGMDWQGLRVLAFAGIGRPAKFYATLRAVGADVVQTHSFDDHQPLPETLLRRMESEASEKGLQMVTTEKDAVRLPHSFQQKVLTLPVRLKIVDDRVLTERLKALLQA